VLAGLGQFRQVSTEFTKCSSGVPIRTTRFTEFPEAFRRVLRTGTRFFTCLPARPRIRNPKFCWHASCIKDDRHFGLYRGKDMGRGSGGNVIAALASFFIPGLGQLLQGRWLIAAFMFVLTALLWLILLGWIIHLWAIVDAAMYEPDPPRRRAYYREYY